jgi:flagellar M-ring protein FliF
VDQLKQLLKRLDLKQRFSIAAGVLAMGALIVYVTHWSTERDFRPLFTGLSAEDAGAIVQKLKETGVEYRVADTGGSVLVPSAKVSELRLDLASAGIPKSGRIGFELFDKNNLGLTDFSEHVNYRRALEGELERSIMAIAEVEQARVHITFPKDSVFIDARQAGKASVLIKIRAGQALKPGNVVAISHLVASAVEGLQPDAVAVLDMHGNLLSKPRRGTAGEDDSGASDANIEYRQEVEKLLLAKINNTLEPLLGHDGFRANVSADCNFSSGEESQETFDPTKSVMLSERKTEDISNGASSAGGTPGTSANLPRPPARPDFKGANVARRTEDVQYQSSRLVRKVSLPKGTLERLSVAVLVDQRVKWTPAGKGMKKETIPPSPEEVNTIKQLVTAAVGLNTQRGDQLVVETLPFDATQKIEPPESPAAHIAPPSWTERLQKDMMLQIGVAGTLVLLLVASAVGLMLRSRRKRAKAVALVSAPQLQQAQTQNDDANSRLATPLASVKALAPASAKSDALLKEVRSSLAMDSAMCAQVLRVWLEEDGKA